MNHRFTSLIRISFAILDLFVINIAFAVNKSIYLISGSKFEMPYLYLWCFINIMWLGLAWTTSVYQGPNISSVEQFARKTFYTYLYYIVSVLCYLFFLKQQLISRVFIASMLSSIGVAIFLIRMLHLGVLQFLRNREYLVRKILIIGYNAMSKKLAFQLEIDPVRTEIVGFCEEDNKVKELSNYPIISRCENIIELSKKYHVTEIYSTIAPEQDMEVYQMMQEADQACIRFKVVPDFNHFIRRSVHLNYLGDIPVLSLRKEPLEDLANRIKKRVIDIVISSMVIVFILSWMIPLVGLLIWIESRGPVFFVQQRSGKDNKPFNCYKFRSMQLNNEANNKQASKGDARITRIGRFLRSTSLDEFPQFLNVFMSNMSIVGPRPHMLKHTADYSALLNQYMVRQFLKPGITGWAQINGYRGETKSLEDMHNRVDHDLWYMENWSLWLDSRIILLTAFNMVKGEQNAF